MTISTALSYLLVALIRPSPELFERRGFVGALVAQEICCSSMNESTPGNNGLGEGDPGVSHHSVSEAVQLVAQDTSRRPSPAAAPANDTQAAAPTSPTSVVAGTEAASQPSVTNDSTKSLIVTPRLTGYVWNADDSPAVGADVKLSSRDSSRRIEREARTDAFGKFRFDSLPIGHYRITIRGRGANERVWDQQVSGDEDEDYSIPSRRTQGAPSATQLLATLFALFLYGLSILLARWNHIARSVHAIIRHRLTSLFSRLDTEFKSESSEQAAALLARVKELQQSEEQWRKTEPTPLEYFFWSRGHENAIWIAIHDVEQQMAAFLSPNESVNVYLAQVASELRQLSLKNADELAELIRSSLAAPDAADPALRLSQERTRRALLSRGLGLIFRERDSTFSGLMEWQNKAGWLALVAGIVIAFLAGADGRAILFLAGGAGGYLSRLMRALKSTDIPLDYGASWSTLFLSPLFGALAGWFGIALVTAAASEKLNLLGSAFQLVNWDTPYAPTTLSIAFLFGFSERLFDSVLGALEGAVSGAKSQSKTSSTGATVTTSIVNPATPLTVPTPVIREISKVGRDAGAPEDALEISGSGFQNGTTATINGLARVVDFKSAESIRLRLLGEDLTRIAQGGDSTIVLVNPGGTPSLPHPFV